MQHKIDTKEKFHVITPEISFLSEIMADELIQTLRKQSQITPGNIIVNAKHIAQTNVAALQYLVELRTELYDSNKSFVFCCATAAVMAIINENELQDALNVTPTESEAWDIVQMDEIEREFFTDENNIDALD